MSVQQQRAEHVVTIPAPAHAHGAFSRLLNREGPLGYILLLPALLVLIVFVAYPFGDGIYLALTDAHIGQAGPFVGLANFTNVLEDPIFTRALSNTFLYTFVTVIFKLLIGLGMAAMLTVPIRFNKFVKAALLLPWIIPTVLSTLAFLWLFDPTYSVLNYVLKSVGIKGPQWLGVWPWPMVSLMIVNIWRGAPFFGIACLAAMQTVPVDLYEAAVIDGASSFRRWWSITLPTIKPVILIVTLLSIIMTFADFQVIWILKRGGPANMTQVLSTYAFQVGIQSTNIGTGAAVSLYMFPVLCITIAVVMWLLRRD